MIISIASGKGGTGKTTVATNLAAAIGRGVQLLDCDVEAPNAHLFLHPDIQETQTVTTPVPEIDLEKCNGCGKCADICRFKAIAVIPGTTVMTFPELCHGCGGCMLVCPEGAVRETGRPLGVVEKGRRDDLAFVHGRLRVGEAMAPPLIRSVRGHADPDRVVIIDAPPGTSCPVIAAVNHTDFVLLVTEPTPFGLHDLKLAASVVDILGIPAGLIVNRSAPDLDCVAQFAAEKGLPVLMEIPFSRPIAEACARGATDHRCDAGVEGPVRGALRAHPGDGRKRRGRAMKELVVISGKGGTGKTSLTAAFASLARGKVLCDADVDAADLHLLTAPRIRQRRDFQSGNRAVIDPDRCTGCGLCRELCRWDAIGPDFTVDAIACEGCGVCVDLCPEAAVDFPVNTCGQWFVSDTRFGPMVHAALGVAEENSGRLVSLVRREARRIAEADRLDLILTDGPPGVGCPVIASIGAADAVLVVTEPTVSGAHDMRRVVELARHFRVPVMICINKFDLNPAMTRQIQDFAMENGAAAVGTIPFDPIVTQAMVAARTVIEAGPDTPAGQAIQRIWNRVAERL